MKKNITRCFSLDKGMKELETMQEESTVRDYQFNEKFSNHEQRITKLESAAQLKTLPAFCNNISTWNF